MTQDYNITANVLRQLQFSHSISSTASLTAIMEMSKDSRYMPNIENAD